MLLLSGLALGVLIAWIRGGSLGSLAKLRLRAALLLVSALVVEVILFAGTPAALLHAQSVGPVLYVSTIAIAAIWMIANRSLSGSVILATGWILNILVILANSSSQFSLSAAVMRSTFGASTAELIGSTHLFPTFEIARAGIALGLLGDAIRLPQWLPYHSQYTLGDLLVALGAFLMVVHAMTPNRPLRVLTPEARQLLSHWTFRAYAAMEATSSSGDGLFRALLVLDAYARTHSPLWLGVVFAAETLPWIVLGPLIGTWVDRSNRRHLMLYANLVRLSLLLAAVVLNQGVLSLAVIALTYGVASATWAPARSAMLPRLVTEGHLMPAVSVQQGLLEMGALIGPAIAGIAVLSGGLTEAYVVGAVMFAVSALATLPLRELPSTTPAGEGEHTFMAGFMLIFRQPLLRAMATLYLLINVTVAVQTIATVIYFQHDLGLAKGNTGNALTAAALTAAAVGTAIASLSLLSWGARLPRRWLLACGMALQGAGLLPMALHPGASAIPVLWAVQGFGNGMASVTTTAYLVSLVPDNMRGRVFSAGNSIFTASLFVFSALVGIAIQGVGAPTVMWLTGCLVLTGTAVTLVMGNWVRLVATDAPDGREMAVKLRVERAGPGFSAGVHELRSDGKGDWTLDGKRLDRMPVTAAYDVTTAAASAWPMTGREQRLVLRVGAEEGQLVVVAGPPGSWPEAFLGMTRGNGSGGALTGPAPGVAGIASAGRVA